MTESLEGLTARLEESLAEYRRQRAEQGEQASWKADLYAGPARGESLTGYLNNRNGEVLAASQSLRVRRELPSGLEPLPDGNLFPNRLVLETSDQISIPTPLDELS